MIFTFFVESPDNTLRIQTKWIYKAPCYAINFNQDLPRWVKHMVRGLLAPPNPTVNPGAACPVQYVGIIIPYEIINAWYAVSA